MATIITEIMRLHKRATGIYIKC